MGMPVEKVPEETVPPTTEKSEVLKGLMLIPASNSGTITSWYLLPASKKIRDEASDARLGCERLPEVS